MSSSRKTSRKSTPARAAAPAKDPGLDAAPRLDGRVLNALADVTDLRDRIYEPALLDLAISMDPPDIGVSPIADQGAEGACTGFALASAITLMNRQRYLRRDPTDTRPAASARMLYEMAKINDEWPGEDYEGSSIRAALKGFYHNGVCSDLVAPYVSGERGWYLKVSHAKDARNLGLGAYYRLRPEIIDYHAALNEAGVVYVSAQIHEGWSEPPAGKIVPQHGSLGGHAFIIVGYDDEGFLVQNSWGAGWGGFKGKPGIAHWSYEDWSATVMDAWVLRLSVPTPRAFDLTYTVPTKQAEDLFGTQDVRAPRHEDIIGHIIHLDDGKLRETGKYPTPITTIRETADLLAAGGGAEGDKYRHLVFYAHGGLNTAAASANRVRKMKDVFKRNGIYPVHFMWETGLCESLKDVIFNAAGKAEERVGGLSDFFDKVLETLARPAGRALWRDMKWDAGASFAAQGGGREAVKVLLDGNARRTTPLQVHLVGHSAGAIFLAQLLKVMDKISDSRTPIRSCSLMAPACTVDLYREAYEPRLGIKTRPDGITALWQYNLTDGAEQDDHVGPYRKSLLYFVSNAFEDDKKAPLLGMETFSRGLSLKTRHKIHYAVDGSAVTASTVHGGFDNDRLTMNDILKNILGEAPDPTLAFQDHDMTGY